MPQRIWVLVITASLILAAQGCVTSRAVPDLPSALQPDEGLLVARLYVLGMQAMENASVEIDGKSQSSAMRDGYIAIPLPAGQHTLSRARAAGKLLAGRVVEHEAPIRLARGAAAPTFIYIPGGGGVIHYTTLGIDRTFTIEPGRVTNLGLLVYLPQEDPAGTKRATVGDSRQFNVVPVDNGAETSSFLETNYPQLMGSLANRSLILAPSKYLDPTKLPLLRRAIAYHESRGPHVVSSPARMAVYGKAGTVVILSQGATKDAPPSVEILDTGTLADVVGGVRHGERFTFVTSDARVLAWEAGKLTQTPLPYRVQPIGLHRLGQRGLLVIDNHVRILTARAAGEPWTDHPEVMVTTPRNDLSVASDDAGAYVSIGNEGYPTRIYRVDDAASVPRPVPAPEAEPYKDVTGHFFMVSRPAGLFVLYGTSTFLFRAQDGRWEHRVLPGKACKGLKLDDQGREFGVECDGKSYRSQNGGATWSGPET